MSNVEAVQGVLELAKSGEATVHELLDSVHAFLQTVAQGGLTKKAGEGLAGESPSLQELNLSVSSSLSHADSDGDTAMSTEESEVQQEEDRMAALHQQQAAYRQHSQRLRAIMKEVNEMLAANPEISAQFAADAGSEAKQEVQEEVERNELRLVAMQKNQTLFQLIGSLRHLKHTINAMQAAENVDDGADA